MKGILSVLIVALWIVLPGSLFGETIPEAAREHFLYGKKAVEQAVSPLDIQQAEKEFGKAVAAAPQWAAGYYNLALVAEETGKQVKAIKNYQKYLDLAKNSGDAADVLARIS